MREAITSGRSPNEVAVRVRRKPGGIVSMSARRLKTKVLVDGGDPQETLRVKSLVGYVDGQTTNPSLIAKNPKVRKVVSSG